MAGKLIKKGIHYRAGVKAAKGILAAVELMYQHKTAYRFLCGMTRTLELAAEKRLAAAQKANGK